MLGGIRSTVLKLLHTSKKAAGASTDTAVEDAVTSDAGSSDHDVFLSGLPVLAVCLVDFHHSTGPELEMVYPEMLSGLIGNTRFGQAITLPPEVVADNEGGFKHQMIKLQGECTATTKYFYVDDGDNHALRLLKYCDLLSCLEDLASYALPDGSHRLAGENSTLLVLPTKLSNVPLYAVATLNSINVSDLDPQATAEDYKREVIQKALVVVSEIPFWESLLDFNRKFCRIIFDRKDFKYADSLMKMMATALNQDILSRITRITMIESMPSDLRTLVRKLSLENVPICLKKWCDEQHAVFTSEPKRKMLIQSRNIIQAFVLQHVPEKTILVLLKAMLLESQILIWGPNSPLVSSLVIYLTSILPLYRNDFYVDLAHTLILPYAPLDIIVNMDKHQPYVVGTTNSILLSGPIRSDLVVLLPHEDMVTTSRDSSQTGTHHIHPSKVPYLEFRNKRLKHAVHLGEPEAKLLRSVAARQSEGSTEPQSRKHLSDNENKSETSDVSPRRFSDLALNTLCISHRGVRRSSVDLIRRAATANGKPSRSIASAQSLEDSAIESASHAAAAPDERIAEGDLSFLKLARGFRLRNFPERLVEELETSTDLRSILQSYTELLCRLSAFGGGEGRDLSSLAAIIENNRMYYQIGTSTNISGTFWQLWMRTKNFDRMFRGNALPKIPYYGNVPPRIGFARFRYSNGDIYRGWFTRGLRHDTGFYRGLQVAYNGQWLEDRRSGLGLYRAGKLCYAGEWKADIRSGLGFTEYDGIERLCGQFRANKLHGVGVYVNSELRIRYEGDFVHGEFHGHAILRNESGRAFNSSMISPCPGNCCSWNVGHDCKTGGYVYEGGFSRGTFHGQGTLSVGLSDDDGMSCDKCSWLYVGSFAAGRMEGYGQMYYADGATYVGLWRANGRTRGVFYSPRYQSSAAWQQRIAASIGATSKRIQEAINVSKRVVCMFSVPSLDRDGLSPIFPAGAAIVEKIEAMEMCLLAPKPPTTIEALTECDWLVLEGGWNTEFNKNSCDGADSADSTDRVSTTRSWSGQSTSRQVRDCADQNLNWTISKGTEWRYTGGIVQEHGKVKFNGYGQLIIGDGTTLECYWHHGCQQGPAVVRREKSRVEWGAWLVIDEAGQFTYCSKRQIGNDGGGFGYVPDVSASFFERPVFLGSLVPK